MTASLPIVDISPFLDSSSNLTAAHHKTISVLRDALLNQGFFYLTGHGISTSKTQEILSLARTFFQHDAEEKTLIKRQDPGVGLGDGARGYQIIGENVTQGHQDWHEALDLYRAIHEYEGLEAGSLSSDSDGIAALKNGTSVRQGPFSLLQGVNLWPSHPTDFRKIYEDYIQQLLDIGTLVLRAMGYALDLRDPETFVKHTRESFWVMRVIGYPPLDPSLAANGGVSCGEHSDYGCLTLLLQDDTRNALMVRDRSGKGEWITANPIEGAYVVNVGDMVERWTGGLVKSTRHRVVHTGENYRVSVPFFMEPDKDCLVKPLDECVDRLKQSGRQVDEDHGIVYWDHLVSKVGGNFYGSSSKTEA